MNSEPNINPVLPPVEQNSQQVATPQPTIDTSPQTVQQTEPHNIKEQLETPLADRLITKYGHWVHKIVVWGLMFQGLRGIYGSGIFIFIEMPAKELALQNGLIGQGDINSLASKIILMMIGASISMIFALRLKALKSGAAQKIQTALGIFLFIANSQLMKFLNSQNSSKILSDLILKFFQE
jgi:hypothetical protein